MLTTLKNIVTDELQATTRWTVGVFFLYIFTLYCSKSWSSLSIRPKLQDKDQDQSCKTKTKTKTRVARPIRRPRPQPTIPRPVFVGLRPVVSYERGLRPYHWLIRVTNNTEQRLCSKFVMFHLKVLSTSSYKNLGSPCNILIFEEWRA